MFCNHFAHLAVQVTIRCRVHAFGSKHRIGEKGGIVRWIALEPLPLNRRQTKAEFNAQLVEHPGDLYRP